MSTIDIRPATIADLDDMNACVQAAYAPYIERMGKRPAPMDDDLAGRIADGTAYVAHIDGRFAGTVMMWAEDDHWYLDNIAVSEDARGTGVGGAMLAAAERAAIDAGFDEIRLYTNIKMTENLTYYPRRGYVETHRSDESGFMRVYFAKRLT